jgi:hypothetical protein
MKHRLSIRLVLSALFISDAGAAQVSPQSLFYPLTPCRAVDTRNPNGAYGGPALVPGARGFLLAGACGVPITARAVALNVVVTGPTAAGDLAIYPSGTPSPQGATAINYGAGQTRANNYIARLGTTGDIAVFTEQASGTVHLILDVFGYFQDPPAAPLSTYAATADITSFGASPYLLAHIRDVGVNGWLNEQLATPPTLYPTISLAPNNIPGTCTGTCQRDFYTMYPLQKQFFLNALYSPDQLRQRVAWALHKFIVVSGTDLVQPGRMVPYLNILVNNAFGNYRDILYQITLNPAMGQYLNMDTSTLKNPNENYAREVMQLFSIGLFMLNPDGTRQMDISGNPIPTYTQTTITEFARIFTGWQLPPTPTPGTDNYLGYMASNPANHDKGSKTLLNGTVVPANQTIDQDLNAAIDNIFNHPNVGPFVGSALIRSLVTSNPSPAFVGRITAVFNNNGSGVRGDLAAVVRAIVTDPEALAAAADPNFGMLRDPVMMTVALLRGVGATGANGTGQSDGVLASQVSRMGQTLFQPDTVFGYYPADYQAPGTSLLGPEFGILSAITAFRRANFVNTMVYSTIPVGTNNPSGTSLDFSGLQTLAANPAALVEELNQVLCRGLLSASEEAAIATAVNAAGTNPKVQAQVATYLVATSSQFQVER